MEDATSIIGVNGETIDVVPDDLANILGECRGLLAENCTSLRIRKPAVQSRSANSNLLLLLDLGGHLAGVKRCAGSPLYVRREAIVHRLRVLGGMEDYPVRMLSGIILRSTATRSNCQPFDGWENSELVLMDFGADNSRRNFYDLSVDDIGDIGSFFEQYGKWCAFDYIIGAKDRHPRNYIYDLSDHFVYSVDNEERPYDANFNFISFDSELSNFRSNVQKFMPPMPDPRKEVITRFGRGLVNCWTEIKGKLGAIDVATDPELSRLGAETDLAHIRAVLAQRNPSSVLSGISLQ